MVIEKKIMLKRLTGMEGRLVLTILALVKKGLDNSSTKLFSLKNPEGEIITSFTNDFRDTYGLDPSAVWRVRTGIFTHTKGWTLP